MTQPIFSGKTKNTSTLTCYRLELLGNRRGCATGQVVMVSERGGVCCHLQARGLTWMDDNSTGVLGPSSPFGQCQHALSGAPIWGTHGLFTGTKKDTCLSVTHTSSPPQDQVCTL